MTLAQGGAVAGDATTSAGFDGSTGKVSLSTPGLPTASGTDVTVEFWMNWDGNSASTMPFGFGGYDLWLANGNLGFNTLNSDLYGTAVSGLANHWVHVTAVFHNGDATQSKLYLNGVAQTLSQIYGTTTTAAVGSTAQISGFAGGGGFNFGGRVQDVAVYPYALGSDRVTAQYQAGTATANPTYTYAYDGDGLRVSKTVNSTAETFTWDNVTGGVPLLIVDGTTSILYGPDGAPLEQQDGSASLLWYHHDQLGSTRVLTNGAGAVAGTATYDPNGRTLATTGVTTPLGYAGQYTDAESGLVYLRARYYDPATAQFMSRDPMVAITRSPYAYVNGNPVNATDPSGMFGFSCDWCGQAAQTVSHAAQATGNWVKEHRSAIATTVAAVGCVATGLVACGLLTAAALAIRIQQRDADNGGFRKSLGANVIDVVVTGASFGLLQVPSSLAEAGIEEGLGPAAVWAFRAHGSLPDVVNWFQDQFGHKSQDAASAAALC